MGFFDIFSDLLGGTGEGDFFGTSAFNKTKLDPTQQRIEQMLAKLFGDRTNSLLNNLDKESNNSRALKDQLKGIPDFSQNQNFFNKGLLEPALRGFNRDIAPSIKSDFAGQGATFSTARGHALTNARSDVFANAQSQLAQYNAQAIEGAKNRQLQAIGIPMQQQLQRIAGTQGAYAPLLQLMGTETSNTITNPGMGSQALSAY